MNASASFVTTDDVLFETIDCGTTVGDVTRNSQAALAKLRADQASQPTVAMPVPDLQSLGAMRALSQRLGRPVGPSTGTHLVAMLSLASEMQQRGETGSIVSLLCDSGWRYQSTYHNPQWVREHFGGDVTASRQDFLAWLEGPLARA